MKSKDEARHSSLIETKTYCESKIGVWTGEPSFTADFNTFKNKLTYIEQQKQKHLEILIGFAIDKANKESALIEDLKFITGRLQVWASPTNNNRPDIKAAATISDSAFARMNDTILLSKANNMKTIIDDTVNNPNIVPNFITLVQQNNFYQRILDFEAVYQVPEGKIDERAVATKNMLNGLKDGIKFRKEILLPDAKFWIQSNADFFKSFKQSMKIDNNPTHKLALKGGIKENSAGNPAVPNVIILINELGLKVKSGPKGYFLFKSIPPGQYTVVFIKYGYVQQQKTVYINNGERTDLNIIMDKIV